MVQAIFDDKNPQTAFSWRYPDTGVWDPERNTDEFNAMLPEYRRHGLLAVTVGLQGGGSNYTPGIYDEYENSAFDANGNFRPAYFARLKRVLQAADAAGMVVIVNYFYWKQAMRLRNEQVLRTVTAALTDWLLQTGYRNILVDVMNEVALEWPEYRLLSAEGVHELIEIVQQTTLNKRNLLVGSSSRGEEHIAVSRWAQCEDLHLPHGNGCSPDQLRAKLRAIRATDSFKRKPRPIVVNEDSPSVDNFEAAIAESCSWGFYSQGYGSQYKSCLVDWSARDRETQFEALSGFQTVPINWSINTDLKRAFFKRLAEVTQTQVQSG